MTAGPVSPTGQAGPPAVLHDIRYSRFTGEIRPRWYSVVALARSSVLRALGVRRSAGSKVWPFLLIAAALLPAIIAVGVPVLVGKDAGLEGPLDVLNYDDYLVVTSILVIAYTATTVPSLVTRDRRDRVLSLYFATTLSPIEYVVGKLKAAYLLVLLLTLTPLLVLLLGGIIAAATPVDYARDHAGDWPKVVLAALVVSVFHGSIALAIGSLTARRVFAIGGYVALMLVPAGVAGILQALSQNTDFLALNFGYVPVGLTNALFASGPADPTLPSAWLLFGSWIALVALSLATLVIRYVKGADR